MEKLTYHARLQEDLHSFAHMLIDLNDVVKPKIQIMDAVIGMESDGSFAGDPRKNGAILASSDYSAIDIVTCWLISVDPMYAPTVAVAVERGYLQEDLSDISLLIGLTHLKYKIKFNRHCGLNLLFIQLMV